MITPKINQFKALLSKELQEAFGDKRAMLAVASAMMTCSSAFSLKGAAL